MIRTYQSGDETAFIRTWNQSLPQDGIAQKSFVNQILADPNFDPEGLIIAEEQGHIVGGLIAIVRKTPMAGLDLEHDTGWITAFFVHPAFRRRGLGRALLHAADTFFDNRQRKFVYFASYAPNYFVPGIDRQTYPEAAQLLETSGFRKLYQCAAMDKNLVGFHIPETVREIEAARKQEGYVVEPLSLPYVHGVIDFTSREFDPDWTRALRDALRGGVPMSNILICRQDQSIAGFCLYGGYGGVGERFGPFGVAQSLRGTGLGKLLLYRCLEQMLHDGLHNAWFLWTGEKEPAGYLYRRAGFLVTRRFDVMKKVLA